MGETQGPCGNIGKGHGAVGLQRRQPGIERGGNHGTLDTFGHGAAMALHEIPVREGCRPGAEPVNGDDGTARRADHDRGDARHIDQIRLHHTQGQPRRTTGIHGVTTGFEHGMSGGCREIMPGGDDVPRPADLRSGDAFS